MAVKVLIVDDIEANRVLLEEQIAGLGHSPILAENGLFALEKMESQPPDLVLLDILMPEIDGYEVLEKMKRDRLLRQIPVIMITAVDEIESTVRCIEKGADDYLTKPFNPTLLKARISACLEKKQWHDQEEKYLKRIEELLSKYKEDINFGAKVQKQILTNLPNVEKVLGNVGYQVSFYNRPATTITGDFIWPKEIDNNSAGLFFADSCGHGLQAALLSVFFLPIIRNLESPLWHPSEFLARLTKSVQGLIPSGKFVACNYLIFGPEIIIFANAGQSFPILLQNGTVEELEIGGPPIGFTSQIEYRDIRTNFSFGDRLILYTDGITEATNSKEEVYGKERLMQSIRKNALLGIHELKDQIITDVRSFVEDENFEDDITIAIFEKREG